LLWELINVEVVLVFDSIEVRQYIYKSPAGTETFEEFICDKINYTKNKWEKLGNSFVFLVYVDVAKSTQIHKK